MRAATPTALGILLLLGACTTQLDAPLSPTFGVAVGSLRAQIVPPTEPNDAPPEGSAARGVAAVKRYERGQPKVAEAYATSSVGSTLSGNAASGASSGSGSGIDK